MTTHIIYWRFPFFFNDTATTEIYTLSLHDALPIWAGGDSAPIPSGSAPRRRTRGPMRSEDHTSELQSRPQLVCRLLLEKKNIAVMPQPAEERLHHGPVAEEIRPLV